jgi:hypothetical protein
MRRNINQNVGEDANASNDFIPAPFRNIDAMKYLSLLFLVVISFSCKPKPKELLRFVNDQNDGFNGFNICIYSDSSYEKREWESNAGQYTMTDSAIYFKTGPLQDNKLVFGKDSAGCISQPQLIYEDRITAMRIILDSLFCPVPYAK